MSHSKLNQFFILVNVQLMSVILSIIGNRIYLVVGIPAPMFNVYWSSRLINCLTHCSPTVIPSDRRRPVSVLRPYDGPARATYCSTTLSTSWAERQLERCIPLVLQNLRTLLVERPLLREGEDTAVAIPEL